jgi:glucose-6-phosphate 1-dehydrogenase
MSLRQGSTTRNHLRFRISPEMTVALGAAVLGPDERMDTESVEIIASSHPSPSEMDAYERILGDAMTGEATLFAREDYVEEAWRIIDPALKAATPIYEYNKGTWGPDEVAKVSPPEGWHNPAATDQEDFRVSKPVGTSHAA